MIRLIEYLGFGRVSQIGFQGKHVMLLCIFWISHILERKEYFYMKVIRFWKVYAAYQTDEDIKN
jgi:hypothetical protein